MSSLTCTARKPAPTVWPVSRIRSVRPTTARNQLSLFSEVAERVEVVSGGQERLRGADQPRRVDGYVWHAYLPTVTPGRRYGFRVRPVGSAAGHRCDPSKLLLDPYGKSFHGDFDFTQALFST